MKDYVKIPTRRLKVLRKHLKEIENITSCKIKIGKEIEIECEDPFMLLRLKEVIKAIGRGFDVNTALNLLDEDYTMEIVNIKEFSGKSKSRMRELKGRVIGRHGDIKKTIENKLDVKLSIYGKTVAIIGKWEDVELARKTVESILAGSKFSVIREAAKQKMFSSFK